MRALFQNVSPDRARRPGSAQPAHVRQGGRLQRQLVVLHARQHGGHAARLSGVRLGIRWHRPRVCRRVNGRALAYVARLLASCDWFREVACQCLARGYIIEAITPSPVRKRHVFVCLHFVLRPHKHAILFAHNKINLFTCLLWSHSYAFLRVWGGMAAPRAI